MTYEEPTEECGRCGDPVPAGEIDTCTACGETICSDCTEGPCEECGGAMCDGCDTCCEE